MADDPQAPPYEPNFHNASSQIEPEPQTGRSILAETLPPLLSTGHSTKSESIHTNLSFIGEIEHWKDFEQEVAKCYEKEFPKNAHHPHILGFKPKHNREGLNHTFNEMVYVGDEHSLQGRFTQQALVSVTTALLDVLPGVGNNMVVRYGDSKTSNLEQSNTKLPDFVASKVKKVTENEHSQITDITARVLGEAKVFWTHHLSKWMDDDGLDQGSKFRQIAQYMRVNQMKFAFLTTYNETVFLKQSKDQAGIYRLHISNPIDFKDKYVVYDKDENIGHPKYKGCVTLRQCLFYMSFIASEDDKRYKAPPPDPKKDPKQVWVKEKYEPAPPTGVYKTRLSAAALERAKATGGNSRGGSSSQQDQDTQDTDQRQQRSDRHSASQTRSRSRDTGDQDHGDLAHRSKPVKQSSSKPETVVKKPSSSSTKPETVVKKPSSSSTKPETVVKRKVYLSKDNKTYKDNTTREDVVNIKSVREDEQGTYYRGRSGTKHYIEIVKR